MLDLQTAERVFLVTAAAFQAVLLAHFALRRWRFSSATRHGWLVYALSVPFAVVSLVEAAAGAPWWLWLGGLLYLAWAALGFVVEYRLRIEWRNPVRWTIFGPYLALYLATTMFYWWPAAQLSLPAWGLLGLCFLASTILNLSSHRRGPAPA